MADLITHTCVALLVKAGTGGGRVRVFVAGSLLPDILARAPAMVFSMANRHISALPDGLVYMWVPLHLPVGMVPAALGLSLLFPEEDRRSVFVNLLGGMLLHLAIDLLQRHYTPGYRIFFPFWSGGVELGLIGSEDTVRAVPVLLGVTALVWWLRHRRARRSL